jgi:hypothetical protein
MIKASRSRSLVGWRNSLDRRPKRKATDATRDRSDRTTDETATNTKARTDSQGRGRSRCPMGDMSGPPIRVCVAFADGLF